MVQQLEQSLAEITGFAVCSALFAVLIRFISFHCFCSSPVCALMIDCAGLLSAA
jgi:hypothetical protein